MRNELRIYLCEVLLHLILYLVPKTENGLRLVKSILFYVDGELNGKN